MAQEALEHAVKQSLQETINKESVQETINKGVQEAIKTHTQAIDKRHTTKQQVGAFDCILVLASPSLPSLFLCCCRCACVVSSNGEKIVVRQVAYRCGH